MGYARATKNQAEAKRVVLCCGVIVLNVTFEVAIDAEKMLEFHGALNTKRLSDNAVGDLCLNVFG